MKRALCRRLEQVLVHGDSGMDAGLVESMQRHLPSCPACRRHQRTWALVRESAFATNDVLDDLTSARVFARVQARLAAHAPRDGEPERLPRPMRTRFAWSLAFASATILAFVLGTRLRKPEPGSAMAPVALEPYALHVPTDPGAAVSRKGLDHLELPPRASMRARLGRAADSTLLGPLELTIRDSEKPRVELELGRGTLLADFDGSGGRSLRISTPDATVDIVGTRFIVDASGTRTRVAVDHGLVRVESKGRLRTVGSGLSWSTDGDALAPLDEGTARMFDRAALGHWEELASEPAPKDEASETSRAGATRGAKTTERDTSVSRREGAERTARQRRVHVRRARASLEVDAGAAHQAEHGAGQTSLRSRTAASAAGERLASATTPQLPTRSPPPTPTAPHENAVAAAGPSSVPPPATSSVPAPTPPAASRTTVSSLYREAEEAFRRGDDGVGKQSLAALVRTFPHDVMADSARFELALHAHKDGDLTEALAQIRDILGHGTSGPFVEPARFLRCRVYLEEDCDAAETCLVRFLRAYPQSAHDDVAVRALVELSRAKGQCSKASQLAETYLQRHPQGPFAQEAARVRSHCGQ